MEPIRQAAVVVPVCDHKALILERAGHLRFQPGFHSFPGGLIDPDDHQLKCEGPGPAAARCAAVRELLEETGLAGPGSFDQSIAKIREKLLNGDTSTISDLIEGVDWSRWRYLGVWTTPEYANIRFETHFFACRFDRHELPKPNIEVARTWWIDQAEAHARWSAGTLPASPPVLAALDAAINPTDPFDKPGSARDLLSAGGASRYLPLVTPTLPPATHTNCSLVGGEGCLYVVDPAPVDPGERELLWRAIETLAEQGEQLSGVILTHLHHDHLGAAAWLAARADVPILATAQTQSDLRLGLGAGISAGGAGAVGLPEVTQLLAEGDTLPGGWSVLLTPGHAKGHLCLWHAQTGTLIAGDMIASGSTILVEPEQGDLCDYLASLERLAALNPRLIVPAHGLPIAQGRIALEKLRDHRLERERKTMAALQAVNSGVIGELVAVAYDDTPSFLWPLAELSLRSHLNKLVFEGRAYFDGKERWSVDEKCEAE